MFMAPRTAVAMRRREIGRYVNSFRQAPSFFNIPIQTPSSAHPHEKALSNKPNLRNPRHNTYRLRIASEPRSRDPQRPRGTKWKRGTMPTWKLSWKPT